MVKIMEEKYPDAKLDFSEESNSLAKKLFGTA
jgi:hypothetical protein